MLGAEREEETEAGEGGEIFQGNALKMDPPPGSRGKDVICCKRYIMLCSVLGDFSF